MATVVEGFQDDLERFTWWVTVQCLQSVNHNTTVTVTKLWHGGKQDKITICLHMLWLTQIINHISDMYRVYKTLTHLQSLWQDLYQHIIRQKAANQPQLFILTGTHTQTPVYLTICLQHTHTHILNIYLYPFIHATYKQDTVQYSTDPYVTPYVWFYSILLDLLY